MHLWSALASSFSWIHLFMWRPAKQHPKPEVRKYLRVKKKKNAQGSRHLCLCQISPVCRCSLSSILKSSSQGCSWSLHPPACVDTRGCADPGAASYTNLILLNHMRFTPLELVQVSLDFRSVISTTSAWDHPQICWGYTWSLHLCH